MPQTRIIKWSMGLSIAMSVSVCWSLSCAGTIREGRSAMGAATSNTIISSAPNEAKPMPSASVPVESGLALRTIPTLSKPISVGGTTLVPYIGAGFGGGYATELDRSLNAALQTSSSSDSFNPGLRSLFGPPLIPNEVQLGIRLPF